MRQVVSSKDPSPNRAERRRRIIEDEAEEDYEAERDAEKEEEDEEESEEPEKEGKSVESLSEDDNGQKAHEATTVVLEAYQWPSPAEASEEHKGLFAGWHTTYDLSWQAITKMMNSLENPYDSQCTENTLCILRSTVS
jgi:hypothetical protein